MAPKKQKTVASSSSSPSRAFDRRKFVTAEAAEKFDTVLVDRPLVPERGLIPTHADGSMLIMIRERNWGRFTLHPEPACTAIVKEFYANASLNSECTVWVRGRTVSYSRDTINQYYQLVAPPVCQYSAMTADYDVIIQSLTQPGTVWTRNMRTGFLKSFPGKSLSRYGKIWYAFLCAKLMPCTHFSDVTVDRSKLLYAIVTSLDIDVGAVIEASIKRNIKGSTSGGLGNPSLITALCAAAGVNWGSAEPLFSPTTLLDHKLIQRYQVWSGGVSHPRGLGFLPATASGSSAAAPSSSSAPAIPSTGPSSSTAPAPDINLQSLQDQLEMLRRRQSRHRRVQEQRFRRNRDFQIVLAQRQDVAHAYHVQSNEAWRQFFSSTHPGVDTSYFPAPPTMPEFPPPANDDDVESLDTDEESLEDDFLE